MNGHVAETSADREPWVWIMETVLSEIDGGNYKHPYTFDTVDGEFCLLLRTGHVMDHLAHTSALRDKWNGLPVKSDRVFKAQLKHAGVVVGEGGRAPHLHAPRAVPDAGVARAPGRIRPARVGAGGSGDRRAARRPSMSRALSSQPPHGGTRREWASSARESWLSRVTARKS